MWKRPLEEPIWKVDQIKDNPEIRVRGKLRKIRSNHQERFKGKWSICKLNIWKGGIMTLFGSCKAISLGEKKFCCCCCTLHID